MKLVADYIARRIEHAGATLYCMRIKDPRPLLAQGRRLIVCDFIDMAAAELPSEMAARSLKLHLPTPKARDITLMDEAFSWIKLVPDNGTRRLISMRSRFHPITQRHKLSWSSCASLLGMDRKTARAKHSSAMFFLEKSLGEMSVRQPQGCNVVPEHIDLSWLISNK